MQQQVMDFCRYGKRLLCSPRSQSVCICPSVVFVPWEIMMWDSQALFNNTDCFHPDQKIQLHSPRPWNHQPSRLDTKYFSASWLGKVFISLICHHCSQLSARTAVEPRPWRACPWCVVRDLWMECLTLSPEHSPLPLRALSACWSDK